MWTCFGELEELRKEKKEPLSNREETFFLSNRERNFKIPRQKVLI